MSWIAILIPPESLTLHQRGKEGGQVPEHWQGKVGGKEVDIPTGLGAGLSLVVGQRR